MIRQLFRARRRQIIIDINTQKDFLLADGKVCIRNHRRVLSHIRRIMAWARRRNVPIISACEVYPNNNGGTYCIDGTEGQKKIRYTILNKRISFPADGKTDLPDNLLREYRQVILHNRSIDPFDEPHIERLLSEVRAGEFIIIGASAEGAVQATVLGLLQRGKRVTVVTDAVGSHNKKQSDFALRKMRVKGAKLIETKRLAGTSHLHIVGVCHCPRCNRRLHKHNLKVNPN